MVSGDACHRIQAKDFPKEDLPKSAHLIVFLVSRAVMTYFVWEINRSGPKWTRKLWRLRAPWKHLCGSCRHVCCAALFNLRAPKLSLPSVSATNAKATSIRSGHPQYHSY
uniref:Uncharacterized protein n=1 Tax=Mus musculus TaxID=10090 RepID=Q78TB4_MOUSE|nr:unnamed protein product [Mus musculus]